MFSQSISVAMLLYVFKKLLKLQFKIKFVFVLSINGVDVCQNSVNWMAF